MKSYRLTRYGGRLECQEIAPPVPHGTEVVLAVQAAGVCHTDIHVCDGGYDLGGGKFLKMSDRGAKLPHTPGHETVGKLVDAGAEATGLEIGKSYLVYPWIGCGRCSACAVGREHVCTGATRFLGVFSDGGYSTHIVVPHPRYLLDIGRMDPAQAAPLACAGLTAYSAVKKLGSLIETSPILIIGGGGLGLMCLSILKALGARGAVVADIDAAKRNAAIVAGALAAVDPRDPGCVAQVASLTGGPPLAVIDLVGAPDSVQLAVSAVAKGGTCIVIGLVGGEFALSIPLLPLRAITLMGSFVGSLAELQELLALARSGQLPRIPTDQRSLEEADQLLEDLRHGRVIGRGVLTTA
ncbi:Alcohol dehydrogenase [Hyphomicrobiales bacterium]|nr:alcohol dehydrogenase catalytic domain-containing protein [Bosea sp. (in: a-proteobacteria)]CAH1696455.1 Alcohol dehydrogenase [Hyphomicrobiales bacterium]CAH1696462.1 Alcohol dehydrogenase [Hyphomicrobiales bacterium]